MYDIIIYIITIYIDDKSHCHYLITRALHKAYSMVWGYRTLLLSGWCPPAPNTLINA